MISLTMINENKNRRMKTNETPTANISKLGVSGLLKVCTFNQIISGLICKWLGNPSLLILAKR